MKESLFLKRILVKSFDEPALNKEMTEGTYYIFIENDVGITNNR